MRMYRKVKVVKEVETLSSVQGVLEKIQSRFCATVYIYVVLDYAVALGYLQNGKPVIGLLEEEEPMEVPWENVQELRAFDGQQEMLFTRSAQGFICRYTREADYDTENTYAAMAIEEVQKLWGTIQNTSIKGFPGWYLVSSRRGSQILLPPQFSETIKMTGEIGIRVCRYLKVSDNYEAEGLLQYADEKLMEVCQWPKREEGC